MTATTFAPPSTTELQTAGFTQVTGNRRKLWRTGAVAGLGASVATFALAGVATGLDVPMTVAGRAIPALGFAQLTLFATLIGTVLAVVLSRRAERPQRTFVVSTLALTLVSFVPDVTADASSATKIVLVASHVLAAAVVIPMLASRLACRAAI